MKYNIYYIEDAEVDYVNFYNELNNNRIKIHPNFDAWPAEKEIIKLFLQNGNDNNKNEVLKIFKKYNIDLFIIDVSLFHANSGGTVIYENLIKDNFDFGNKYVLFLTYPDTEEKVPTSERVRIEFKSKGKDGKINYKDTGQKVWDNIKELLNIDSSFFDFIDDISKT